MQLDLHGGLLLLIKWEDTAQRQVFMSSTYIHTYIHTVYTHTHLDQMNWFIRFTFSPDLNNLSPIHKLPSFLLTITFLLT